MSQLVRPDGEFESQYCKKKSSSLVNILLRHSSFTVGLSVFGTFMKSVDVRFIPGTVPWQYIRNP